MKNIINNLITEGRLTEDTWVIWGEKKIQIVNNSTDHKIYVYNPETRRAASYVEGIGGVGGYKPVSLGAYNSVVSLLKKRLAAKAEEAKRERERIERWKAEHGEGDNGSKATVVDNSEINAPATKTAVLLDAEREDSKFDYRRGEDVLSRTEADSYEETDSLLDEEKTDLRGHQRAVLTKWENVKGKVLTLKDGSQKFLKPYILLTFEINGELVASRAYSKQFASFKIQANQKFHGLFNYMRDSVALDELVGAEFDVWMKWNELLRTKENPNGEWQADFYDEEAYKARKAREAQVSANSIRGGNTRPTEKKATR